VSTHSAPVRSPAWRSISSDACAKRPRRRTPRRIAETTWRRYVLIEYALRDPQELLDEGVPLSKVAIDLWQQR
jgi:hypothetical protein